jgi:uncharacterized protein (DUF302 family)
MVPMMTASSKGTPPDMSPDGIVTRPSAQSVASTVAELVSALEAAGAKLFVTVDHSGEAARVGLTLRDTKLLIFGNPQGGTPLMQEQPLIALDLPLKILVWEDDDSGVWMSYLDGPWLAERYGIKPDLAKVLSAVDALTTQVAGSPS